MKTKVEQNLDRPHESLHFPTMQDYLNEVETRLKGLKAEIRPPKWKAENYVGAGQSKLVYLDLKLPVIRAAAKQGFSFSKSTNEELWKIWDYIWTNSNIWEAMLIPSQWVNGRPVEDMHANRKVLLKWQERVDNWAHSDELSSHYAKMLEHDPKTYLPIFEKWSRSSNPWMRRQSIVGLQFYARGRKKSLPVTTLLDFIERQMDHDHYFVQKGVGWALRESWNTYPKPTFAYLKKNAHRIAPAGWTAATEKLSAAEKTTLTALRKKARTANKR